MWAMSARIRRGRARLFGDHTFSRVNPGLWLHCHADATLTFYADYNEASRAPTVIELGCSDPDEPCGLPNDFASDPDLKQVVARTVEIGAARHLPKTESQLERRCVPHREQQ